MNIVITEQQYRLILEQRSDAAMDAQAKAIRSLPSEYKHALMTILGIGSAFIPFVGPFIAMGIGIADAKMYYDEGDKKTAALVGILSAIPAIGGLAIKLGLSQWTAKALGELGKKISLGSKLLPEEMSAAKKIAENKNLILSEINKIKSSFKTKPSFANSGGSKGLVTVTGGYSKNIPETVKVFLQKRPNIKVNDLFFNTINNRKENILSSLKDIKKLGQVNGGSQIKIEYNGVDIALTNLKNMSETISKNKNFNLKSFIENAYKARYDVSEIQKSIPRNETGVWNNLEHIKDSVDILIKSLEKIMK
jgi:hypothetical protein